MEIVQLKRVLTEEHVAKLSGKFLTKDHAKVIITQDTDAYNMEGEMLFRYRKNVVPLEVLKLGYESFKGSIQLTDGRGNAAGGNFKRIRKDGSVSKISVAKKVYSGNVGYMDPSSMVHYCRRTAFASKYFAKFKQGIPFVEHIDKLYADLCPEHYAKQIAIANGTNRNFVIGKTSFTTVTVNRNFQTAVHKDSGDLPAGFGNLIVYRQGDYKGSQFCLPEYGAAIDMQNGDALFVDVHRWHGNTPFEDCSEDFMRVAFVLYYREYMYQCKQPSEELFNTKMKKTGFLTL